MNILQPQSGSVDLDLERDYTSNLPKDIKELILMKLPFKEAAKTSLLSTKWKYVWMSIPKLVFNKDCAQSESELVKLVDRVLLLHCAPILHFSVSSRHACNEAIGRWVLVLSRNGIKYLNINLGYFGGEECVIPSSFFSCLALEHVIISGNNTIHVPPSFVGFKNLRTLELWYPDLTGIAIARLISSCPLLESLKLEGFNKYDRLVIHAPNLTDLKISGKFSDLCLETPKLLVTSIRLDDISKNYLDFTMPSKDCKSNILQVLGSLSTIEYLSLYSDFIMYLANGPIPEVLPVPFYRLTVLHIELSMFKEEVAAAFCLFKSAPNLKELHLEFFRKQSYPPSSLAQYFWELKGIESNLFNCLEIVEITDFDFGYHDLILEVAKFVLSTAPVLEELVISIFDDLMDGVAFLKKLKSLPRLSKMAEIDLQSFPRLNFKKEEEFTKVIQDGRN